MNITHIMQDQMRQLVISHIADWQHDASKEDDHTLTIYISVNEEWFCHSTQPPQNGSAYSEAYVRVHIENDPTMGTPTTTEQVMNQIVDKFKWV
jgi:hypothetical protein